ncbi:hypothetical protein [Natrarchaeobius chitinivorans]|uniref:Uncharacterized protein n=1 Tax=Natrarchaeobius chitinivorans TaxID=1679083 RepID=A0A3N6LXL2_NATCH|nr:hypothetical protein [Natrarchaeobius chitinivorans]RQG95538.1 hypothetical protein EA473_08815 [Natrarchaeobius chitinivorans]
MTQHNLINRRTVLSGIATGSTAITCGCLSGGENTGFKPGENTLGTNGIFEDIFIDGTDLVLEFSDDSSIDHVNVIDPNGELFAERQIAAGVDRTRIEIGLEYDPGEYDIIALENDGVQTTQSVVIEPDVRITDLRLARNHPEKMFEGASDIDIRTEAIVGLENAGSGPDQAIRLAFSGEVPRPTPDEYEMSGIYDRDSDIRQESEGVEILPGEELTVYSQLMPFSESGQNVSCSPDTVEGAFQVVLETAIQEKIVSEEYSVSFTGESLGECDIQIEGQP